MARKALARRAMATLGELEFLRSELALDLVFKLDMEMRRSVNPLLACAILRTYLGNE